MGAPGMVPMLSPDGKSGDIPLDRVNDALSAGFKRAVVMTAPSGETGYVPQERAADAIKSGFKVGQAAVSRAADVDAAEHQGIGGAFSRGFENVLQGAQQMGDQFLPAMNRLLSGANEGNIAKAGGLVPFLRNQFTALNPVAPARPTNTTGQRAAETLGNVAGTLAMGEATPGEPNATAADIAKRPFKATSEAASGVVERNFAKPSPSEAVVPAAQQSAHALAKAINPPVNEWNSFKAALANEGGNIVDYAKRTGNPINTQMEFSAAARGAANEAKTFYQEKVLGPVADKQVTVGSGAERMTLGQINSAIDGINDQLRTAYAKRESGQTMTALANESELVARRAELTDALYEGIAENTNLTVDQVKGIRQRYGRQFAIADSTDAALNQRASSAGKALEGRRDVPLTTMGTISEGISKVLGGPEAIGDRNFRKAMSQARFAPAYALPGVAPVIDSMAAARDAFYRRQAAAIAERNRQRFIRRPPQP